MLTTAPKLPLSNWMLALLCAVYLLAGTIGHDPWKVEDAIHLGIAWEFATHGDWLNPRIGSEAWLGGPPLYHWCAASLGQVLSFLLPFHDGARLATALFGALLLLGLALSARALRHENDIVWPAPILAIGTLGLLVPIHDAQPAIAMIAAQSFVYAGIAMTRTRPGLGALLAAGALGIGLLAGGLQGSAALLPPFVFPLLHREWRNWKTLTACAGALLCGIALGGIWPLLLAQNVPDQLLIWWNAELGRIVGFAADEYSLKDHFQLLAWFVWPILPIAIWSIWIKRKSLAEPAMLLPLVGCALSFIEFFLLSNPKPLPSLPLIVPLVMLALPGAERLRRGAANAMDWFGIMTFTLLAGLIWLGGISMATGEPTRVAKNFYKAEPGFIGQLSIPAFIAAGFLTVAWLWILFGTPRSPWRSATRWAAGVTLMWGLIATLWLPWIDFGKTYRPVALSLDKALGNSKECVASMGIGLAQKASLRYFMGLSMQPVEKDNSCPWLLIQGASGKEQELKGMKKVWEGNRGGDKSERLRLYRRK